MRSGQLVANRYRLVELVGSGGAGLVWLAEDEVEHRQVALKRPHAGTGPEVRAELEREAAVAARVRHPGAIQVYGVAGDGADWWLVMEYFPARNLSVLLREDGPLEPVAVARIGAQVAAALEAIHAADVVHRDVTPNNILVDAEGTAKVTDYGISAHRAQTMTSSGKISGTAVYVSPEVANGSGAKAPSDVFSLGASLFAAVEGEPPFGFGDPDVILARIRAGRRASTRRAGPLAPVLEALLQPERAARPTAAQARAMLERVAAGEPVDAWRPPVSRAPRRRRLLATAGAIAGVVVVLLGLVVWSPWRTSAGEEGPLRTVLGDPRTADPCALLEPAVFDRFGPAVEDPAYGNFNRCDVLIEFGQDAEGEDIEIDVVVELLDKTDPDLKAPPNAEVEVEAAEVDDEGGCDVSITLADLNRIDVNARPHGDPAADPCEVAQVAGDRAVELLPPDELTRRAKPFDVDSLARLDACALADRTALNTIPGLDPVPSAPVSRWECEWTGRAATMGARVYFNQNTPLTAEDGQHHVFAGRDVFLQPGEDGDEECEAHVVHRPVHLENGDDIDEIASVAIEGEEPMNTLCAAAKKVARSVAANLPPAES